MFSTQNVQFMFNVLCYRCLSTLCTLCSGCRAGSMHVINDRRTKQRVEAEGKRENTDIIIMCFQLTSPKNVTWAVGFQLSSSKIQHGQSAFS
jgi:hypothetical protein